MTAVNILLCPMSDPGYLYPAIAVGLELERRHDNVWVLGRAASAPAVVQAGLPLLAAEDYGRPSGFAVAAWPRDGLIQYRATLRAVAVLRPDVLVTSVLCHGVLLAAEVHDLPVVVIGLAAHLWAYRAGGSGEPRSPAAREWRTLETLRLYGKLRQEVGLRADRLPSSPLTGTALLLRGDPALEYPGGVLPERVHHVGPCAWEPAADPGELDEVTTQLDQVGKPVVYVHLGRTFGGTSPWPRLNASFTGSRFQAVIEQGRTRDPEPAADADLLVVRKPWMGPLIDRAGFVLTSGTSAPVLGALLRGRPLGVSPAGSEQPLLAEDCVRAGVAVYLTNALSEDPAVALTAAWHNRDLRERARQLGGRLAAADSCRRAADFVHGAVSGRQPVAPANGTEPEPSLWATAAGA